MLLFEHVQVLLKQCSVSQLDGCRLIANVLVIFVQVSFLRVFLFWQTFVCVQICLGKHLSVCTFVREIFVYVRFVREPNKGLGIANQRMAIIINLTPGSTQPAFHTIRVWLGVPFVMLGQVRFRWALLSQVTQLEVNLHMLCRP